MRKLAIAAFCFSAAIFFSRYFLQYEWLLTCCAVTAAASSIGFLFRGFSRLRVIIALLSISVGFLWSFAYTSIFIKPHWVLHNETAIVSAVVTDYPVSRNPRGYHVDVRVTHDTFSSIGTRIYFYNEVELEPGDTIEFSARFRRTDITDDGDKLDALSSRGIFLSAYASSSIKVTDSDENLRYLPKKIAEKLAQKISGIFPADVSHFLQALLIGKRNELYQDPSLSAALSASGIVHVISISGMHVSFLMGFLSVILKNKKLLAMYGIPVLILFMAMTGFTPAVSRAGAMQIFLICAPLFRRESDSLTSLSTALMVLLTLNPYSCASVGLHLSFAATLGIILFTSKINNAVIEAQRGKKAYKKKLPRALINYTSSSLATTIGALVLTLPLTSIHFGYVSLIAPLTNLLTIGVVSLTFPIGLITAATGFIHPVLSAAPACIVTLAARYIIYVARTLAAVPYSVVYSSNAFIMFWLAYVYALFITLPLLKARLRQYLYPVCISLVLLFTIILVSQALPVSSNNAVAVLDVGQGLSVVITSGEHTMVVDCGSSSKNNAGEITHEFLMNLGRTSIDLLAITHFHSDHVNGVEFLLSRITVSALAIPDPDGSFIAEDIIEVARKRGTDIIYVTRTLSVSLGEALVVLYPPVGEGDENEKGISILTIGEITSLITGDMNSTTERSLLRFTELPKLDLLVVGHHGSRHSTSEELLNALKPDIAVIPVGRNSFGHPSPEVLGRLERAEAVVYRTDISGHVIIGGG